MIGANDCALCSAYQLLIFNFHALVPNDVSELFDCMVYYHQVPKWKLVGPLLGISSEQLDIIKSNCNNKDEKCCLAMLTCWCNLDSNASLEKLVIKLRLIGATSEISNVESIKSFLLHRYDKNRYDTWINLGFPYKPENFINMAFILHKHHKVTEEGSTAIGNEIYNIDTIIGRDPMDDTLPQVLRRNYYYTSCTKGTNILEFIHSIDVIPKREPFLLLIEGAPAVGKTTICKEIAFQWSKCQKNDLSLLICLHEAATCKISSFETLFEYVCPGKQTTQLSSISEYLITGVEKRVMVIIDGYEELFSDAHCNSKVFINNLIKRDILQFQKCDIVISTRCAAAVGDISLHKNCYRVELLGFTEELQQQYFECNVNYAGSGRDIVSYLNERPNVKFLCCHPLLINYLVFLYNQLDCLPEFQTELIDKFACIMILWALKHTYQELDVLNITTSTLLKELPQKCQIVLHNICVLAFDTMQEENAMFDSKYFVMHGLVEKKLSHQLGFGFFKVLELLKNKRRFSFHLSLIQEFFAAFFLTQWDINLKDRWSKTEWNYRYINVWLYYFGLRKGVPEEFKKLFLDTGWFARSEKLSSTILQDKIRCLYLLYCFMELPNEGIYQLAKQMILKNKSILDISNYKSLTKESLNIVTSFLTYYIGSKFECFSLAACNLDDDKLYDLLKLFMHRKKYLPKIDTLDLSNNRLTMKSVIGIFRIADIVNASKVLLSGNENISNKETCKDVVSYTAAHTYECSIKALENSKVLFLFGKITLHALQSVTTLTNLYIIRCVLDDKVLDCLANVLKTHRTLSLYYHYDNKLPYGDLLKIFEMLKSLKHIKSISVLEKSLSNHNIENLKDLIIHERFTFSQVLLVSANKIFAQGASDYEILMAIEYNPSVLHLILNDCQITAEVLNKIAVTLNSSSQPWKLLDLSTCKIDDDTLKIFYNALESKCTVYSLNLTSNRLTSLPLIAELIWCLYPNKINISKNSFVTDDDSSGVLVSVFLAKRLFACGKQLNLTFTCDGSNVMMYNKINHTPSMKIDINSRLTHIFVSDCTICGEMLLRSLESNNTVMFVHLAHVKWSGDPLYSLTEFFAVDPFFHINENIAGEVLYYLVNNFDSDVNVSRIIVTNDSFIANKCKHNVLKYYLTQEYLPRLSSAHLFYIRNCLLENVPPNSNILSDYFSKQTMMAEIVLCNNGLSQNSVCRMIKTLQQFKMLKSIFICELEKQLLGTEIVMCLFNIFNCSFMIMDEKVVIGKQATLMQVDRCLRLVSPVTTILRFISCNFKNEHYITLLNVLNHHSMLEEFSFYECNSNDVWIKQLIESLQKKSTLTSLLLSCTKVTPLEADSMAAALSTVVSNNPTLEKVSFRFDNLPPSACARIFQGLSSIKTLKHFRFCDGQVTTKEAKDELKKMIANNSSLEIVNLRNNKLQNSGIKTLAKAFWNIHHLKLLALNGNKIDDKAADDIASIVARNVEIEKLLLYNNSLKSEGICTICQSLKSHKNLQIFRISHNQIELGAADTIADVINHNPLLKIVDVGSNRLVTVGMKKIMESFEKITNLQKLSFHENHITCTDEATNSIAKVIKSNINLKALHLGNNDFSISDISIISVALNTLTSLKELTVNNTGFTADNITMMITNNLLLEILDIGGNKLKSEGVSNISKSLIKLSHLKTLGLYGNEITDVAADDIAGVIYQLPVLEKLLLNNNAFGVVGMQAICKGLKENKALKILQLDNVGITEEVADDIAAVVDSSPSLEGLHLGNNRLQNIGAITILKSLKTKNCFKALAMNNTCISKDVIDNIVEFVISNPKLEELLLQENSFGAAGVLNICKCIKEINALRILNLVDNNVCDEMSDTFTLVIESNTVLEKLSLDFNHMDSKISTAITKLSNLKYLQIRCNLGSENSIYKSVDHMYAHSNLEEITVNYHAEEIHFLSPLNTIETVVVIKVNISELALHIPALHSVVTKDKVEIVCMKDDMLVESEVMKMVGSNMFQRLILVFTKMCCYSDQEMNVLANNVRTYRSVNLLVICKLNSDKYNSDISGIVIIEGSDMIVMFTGDSLAEAGIMKLLNEVKKVENLFIFTDAASNFSDHSVNEICDLISKITKLETFIVRNNDTYHKGIVNVITYLNINITIQTVRLLNTLSIKYYDFTHKSDNSPLVKEIDNHQWLKIFCSLIHKVTLKVLDISGNAINKEVAQRLSILLDHMTKMEFLDLSNCSLGMNLKSIHLQKVTTLKYLNLSNNCLTDVEPIITIVDNSTELEELSIDENYIEQTAGDKLSAAVATLQNLRVFRIDQSIISRKMEIKLITAFSTAINRRLYIYDRDYDSVEAISIIGSLHKINTLSLFKRSAKGHFSFFTAVLKTTVMLSLWDQDNVLNRAGIIRWLNACRKIITIKLANFSKKTLTEQEEEFIIAIIRENTQLENILLGNQSTDAILDDLCTMYIDEKHTIHYEPKHPKPFSTSKSDETGNSMFLSLEFLFKIISVLKYHVNLRILNLSGCRTNFVTKELAVQLAEQLAILVSNSTKLEALLLGDCFLGNKGASVIANALMKINSLKHLDLSENDITKDSLIVSIIEANTGLEKLHLQKNCLHSTAGDRLLVAIVNLKDLKELSIDQNIISRNMALKLATVFSSSTERILYIYNHDNKTMEKIDISGPIFSINTLVLAKTLLANPNQSFKSMSVMTNSTILENGAASFVWMQSDIIRASGVLMFLSSLKTVATVDVHNVSGNELTEIEVDTIATVINENTQLENVKLSNHLAKSIHDDDDKYRNRKPTKKLVSRSEDHKITNKILRFFPNNSLGKILCSLQTAANLKTLDLSGNCITEELAEQLATVLANSVKVEKLSLKDCYLGNKGINLVTNSLNHTTTLTNLDLSNNDITEDLSIVIILNNNTSLTHLYIHKNCLSSLAGDRLSVPIASLQNLKELSIDQNIISTNMALKLVNFCSVTSEMNLFIYDNDHQTSELIKFRYSSSKGINALTFVKSFSEKGNHLLTTLILKNHSELFWNQSNVLNLTGIIRFLSAFTDISTIAVINTTGIKFTELEVNAIVTILLKNVKLKNLWLGTVSVKTDTTSDCNKNDQFTNHLRSCKMAISSHTLLLKVFLALKSFTNLRILDLSGNIITEESAKQLAIVLANSTKLETLLLRDCSLGNEIFFVIANTLKNLTALKHFDLSNNSVVDDQSLENILKANMKLESLYLEKNCLHSSAGDRLIFTLRNLKCLKELSIDKNIISRNMALKLVAAFSTPVIRKLLIYSHEYQTSETLIIRGSLHNISALTLCKLPGKTGLVTTVLETGTAFLRWYEANAINTTGVLRIFNTLSEITTITLHKFSGEFTELEVDAITTIIGSNMSITNLWLGSGSLKVINRDINVLTNKPIDHVDIFSIQELFPLNLQLISPTILFRIFSALKYHTNLKTLDLSGNTITDELAKRLTILLANSAKLEILLLRNCSLSSVGIHLIASSIKNITTLKQLSLSWDNINEEAANYIVTMIESNTRLERMFLDGSLQFVNSCQLSSAIKQHTNLELLQIDCEVIAMDISNELVNSIINDSKFKCLILTNYSLQCSGVIKFKHELRNIKSLILIRITGQDLPSVTASVDNGKIVVKWSEDNVLASTGILRVISAAFKALAIVALVNCTFSDYTIRDVDEIVTLIASFTELEELDIAGYSTALQNHLFGSSRKLNDLTKLNLTFSRAHANAVAKLPTFLLNQCKIQEFQLSHCLFKPSQLVKIINALKTHTVLQTLGIFNINITNVLGIADDIGNILLKNQSMHKFYIGNNRLPARGMIKILGALKQLHCLTELSIGRNNTVEISDNVTKTQQCDILVEVIISNLKLEILGIDFVCTDADGAGKVVKALQSLSSLKVLDISGNNINEEVADDIAILFNKNPNLGKLFVGNNNLGIIGISKIADVLANARGLEALDISNNNITSGAAEDISKIIKSNPKLKVLFCGQESVEYNKFIPNTNKSSSGVSTMSLNKVFIKIQILIIKQSSKVLVRQFFTHCITGSSIFCCKLFLENPEVRSLLNYNKLESEGIKAVSKALATIKSLEALSIENNDINDEAADDIATALASNTGIKQLWIGQNNFTPSGLSIVLQPLSEKLQLPSSQPLLERTSKENPKPTIPTLQVLDLSHSNLSLETAVDISAVLSRNCYAIQQLWLEKNNLSTKSIITIACSLKKCINLSVVSLRDNSVSDDEAICVLSQALSEKFDLQQLYLGNNQLEDGGVIKITEALNTTHGLLTLDLMNNNISEAAADALASVIISCRLLEQLYLGDNKLHSTGTIRIATAIQQATCRSTLRVLDLSNNKIGRDERVTDEISRAVGNTEVLTVLILDDNTLSVDGLLKITRSLSQSESAEYMMIFSVMHNGVIIIEEAKDEMRAVMADQQLTDCVMYF